MPFIIGANSAGGDFSVDNSCRFNSADTAYLTRTCGSTASSYTVSMWVKSARTSGTSTSALWWNAATSKLNWELNDHGQFYYYDASTPKTTGFYRDTGAWYHLVFKVDSNTGTLYINGAAAAGLTGAGSILSLQTGNALQIGGDNGGSTFEGYIAEVCFIDGTALDPDQFGEFNSDSPTIWQPIAVSGLTFGTKGFYLDFEDSSDLGKDVSGNGNDLTATNLAAIDQTTDTPVNNFPTFNPLYQFGGSATVLAKANLQIFDEDWGSGISTIGATKGKWYMEMKCISSTGGANNFCTGIVALDGTSDQLIADTLVGGSGSSVITYGYQNNAEKGIKNTWTSYGNTYTAGDIIGVYMDLDNNKLYFAKNGTLQDSGTGITIDDGYTYALCASTYYGTVEGNYGNPTFTGTDKSDKNGYGSFEYDPSVGTFDSGSKDFYALCTKNLAEFG